MSATTSIESDMDENYQQEKNINRDRDLSDIIISSFQNKEYSDVTFVIDGKQLHCHKIILASQSKYFDAMFKSPLTTSSTIEITTIPYHIFKEIIKFLYTGTIGIWDEDLTMLTEVADMMDLEPLKDTLAEHCQKKFQPSNCLDFYSMGLKYKSEKLIVLSRDYAVEEFENVKETENFKNQPREIISDYLECHDIKTYSEEDIFTAAINWMLQRPKERIFQFCDLIKVIRIEDLSSGYILGYIHHLLMNQPNVICQDDEDLAKDFRHALQQICSLSTDPTTDKYRQPRTKTVIVSGLAIINFSQHSDRLMMLYRYISKNSLKYHKDDTYNPTCRNSVRSNLSMTKNFLVFQNKIFGLFPNNSLLTYDRCTNMLSTSAAPSNVQALVCSESHMYAVSFSERTVQVSRYNTCSQVKWINIFQSSELPYHCIKVRDQCKATFYNNSIYVWGVQTDQSSAQENFNKILVLDIRKKECKVLSTTLPVKFLIEVVQYKRNVLIAGDFTIWKCDLSILEKDSEESDEDYDTSGSDDSSEEESSTSGSEEESNTSGSEEDSSTSGSGDSCDEQEGMIKTSEQKQVNVIDSQPMSKLFVFIPTRINYHMVRVGDKLLMLGGKHSSKGRWIDNRSIYHLNIDDLVSGRPNLEWTQVGMFYNKSISGVVPLSFDTTQFTTKCGEVDCLQDTKNTTE